MVGHYHEYMAKQASAGNLPRIADTTDPLSKTLLILGSAPPPRLVSSPWSLCTPVEIAASPSKHCENIF